MAEEQRFFATAPRGIEPLLGAELAQFDANLVEVGRLGVGFSGGLEMAYRVCLWSRFASRVLMPLARFDASDPELLYRGVQQVDWAVHFEPDGSLAVDFNTAKSELTHAQFGAQKVKDAVVDQFRAAFGVRPRVDRRQPDVRINVHLFQNQAQLSLDLAGESLHRRGYRSVGGQAPLKENLAAAILARADWLQIAAEGGAFYDPMCGSGTLPIEAALMAGDVAPGLSRSYFGFLRWKGGKPQLWARLLEEAKLRRDRGLAKIPPIWGSDADPKAVEIARANVARIGLGDQIRIERRELLHIQGQSATKGLLAVNPPYGERLGDQRDLTPLYGTLSHVAKTYFGGWRLALFSANPKLVQALRLRPRRSFSMRNGALKCRLLTFELNPSAPSVATAVALSPGAEMLANRLRKNKRHIGRWARRQGITCYRLYDADLPEYALAVDLYQGNALWAHVQEYAPPSSVDPSVAARRRQEGLEIIAQVLEIGAEQIFFKERRRQKGRAQYGKLDNGARFWPVCEGDCTLLVNFEDYLDTGLFLDQRTTRAMIGSMAAGKRFLNLFGYTGTATVQAARGGAVDTTTVDMSNTYLEWAGRNLALNGFTQKRHHLVRADCTQWLGQQKGNGYELIYLDPPTFSNSARMEGAFDVQRDHVGLIRSAARLLTPDGILFFSTNFRRFKLEAEHLKGLKGEDISRKTLPEDFKRNPRIRQCWRFEKTSGAS